MGTDNNWVHVLDDTGRAVSVWAAGTHIRAIGTIHRKGSSDYILILTNSTVAAYELRGAVKAGSDGGGK